MRNLFHFLAVFELLILLVQQLSGWLCLSRKGFVHCEVEVHRGTRVFSKVGKGTQSNTLICALTDYKLEAEFIKQYGSLSYQRHFSWFMVPSGYCIMMFGLSFKSYQRHHYQVFLLITVLSQCLERTS